MKGLATATAVQAAASTAQAALAVSDAAVAAVALPKALSGLGSSSGVVSSAKLGLGEAFGTWSSRQARVHAAFWRYNHRRAALEQEDVTAAQRERQRFDVGQSAAAPVLDGLPAETVAMDTDDLNVDLSCPICLGVCRKAVTTIECLHRFCAACIEKSLRLGLKECPTCRERCPSRRFLRPDPNFDALIAVIYPNLDAWEEQETKRIEVLNKQNSANHRELLKNLRDMKNEQNMVRKQRAGKADYMYTGPEITHTPASWPNIGITLVRSAGCSSIGHLDSNELSMPPHSTIGNLCEYVRYKLQSKKKVDVIYRTACGEDVVLGEELAMKMIVSGGPNQVSLRLNYRTR